MTTEIEARAEAAMAPASGQQQQQQGLIISPAFEKLMMKAVEKDGTEAIDAIARYADQERKAQQEQIGQDALTAMAAEMPPLVKTNIGNPDHVNRKGGKTHGLYAKLQEVQAHVAPYEATHGFKHRFTTKGDVMQCIVSHRSGWKFTTEIPWESDTRTGKNAIQAAKSGRSYAKCEVLSDAYGVQLQDPFDDDGNGAGDAGGDVATLNDEQAAHLAEMIDWSGADDGKFRKVYTGASDGKLTDMREDRLYSAQKGLLVRAKQNGVIDNDEYKARVDKLVP